MIKNIFALGIAIFIMSGPTLAFDLKGLEGKLKELGDKASKKTLLVQVTRS